MYVRMCQDPTDPVLPTLMYVGGHGIGINIHGCQPNLEMAIYVWKLAHLLKFT